MLAADLARLTFLFEVLGSLIDVNEESCNVLLLFSFLAQVVEGDVIDVWPRTISSSVGSGFELGGS